MYIYVHNDGRWRKAKGVDNFEKSILSFLYLLHFNTSFTIQSWLKITLRFGRDALWEGLYKIKKALVCDKKTFPVILKSLKIEYRYVLIPPKIHLWFIMTTLLSVITQKKDFPVVVFFINYHFWSLEIV